MRGLGEGKKEGSEVEGLGIGWTAYGLVRCGSRERELGGL